MLKPDQQTQCIGHANAENYFLQAWQKEQMPHGVMFCGAKGIGKATFAYRLIRYVLAGGGGADALFGPADLSVDEASPIFKRVAAHSHGDFLLIESDKSAANPVIKVDATRKIGEFLSKTPSESKWRVVLVDSADDMNPNAANALLKVLEEPPSHSLIILISHNPGKLLPTIHSRCRKIHFKPPNREKFESILQLCDENLTDSAILDALYSLSFGSPGQALELYEQGALELYEHMAELFAQYPTVSMDAIQSLAKSVTADKNNQQWQLWKHVWQLWFYRLNLYSNIGIEPLSSREQQTFEAMSSHAPSERWQRVTSMTNQWFKDTETLHMDRKQVIHSLIQTAQTG